MATGAPDANGIWIYGEDDSEATFSALLNKLGTSTSSALTDKLAALPGKVLKISSMSTGTQVNSSTTTPVSTGVSIAYTPVSSTSKIIVLASVNGLGKSGGAVTGTGSQFYLYKNSTVVQYVGTSMMYELPAGHVGLGISLNYVETSGSTTARTYAVYFNQQYAAGTVNVQRDNSGSSMTIIEVSQ